MSIECTCSLKTRAVGDGCQLCNTDYVIDLLPQPEELHDELKAVFTDSQAEELVGEIFKPLVSLISTLNCKIDQLDKQIEELKK